MDARENRIFGLDVKFQSPKIDRELTYSCGMD